MKSIGSRIWPSLTTVLTVCVVVVVLLAFGSMAEGFQHALTVGGAEDVAIILSGGADREIDSTISSDQVSLVAAAPGIAKVDGKPEVSAEVYVTVDGVKKGTTTQSNLLLRGMGQFGPVLRKGFHVVAGRIFHPGHSEVVVGQQLQSLYRGMQIGDTLRYSGASWKVVGVFSTGGSVYESDIWADSDTVKALFHRPNIMQSIWVKLASPAELALLKEYLAHDPRLKLTTNSVAAYMAQQGEQTSDLIMRLGWPLAIAMALGAIAGAINTTYNSVAARTTEIAVLRAIGFGRFAAFAGTIGESILLSLIGGVLAVVVTYFVFDGLKASTIGSGFTQEMFSFRLGSEGIIEGLGLALIIGLVGGLLPAFSAARMPVIAGLSE